MRKALATLAVGALAAVSITAGAVLLTPSTASAQEDSVVEATGPIDAILGELVDEGVISQDQADAVAERLRDRAGTFGRFGHHRGGGHLEVVADLLGMETEDLVDALQDGQTIADLAGDDTQTVIDALVAEATERLNDAVENERLTQEEADEKLVEITERITGMVNGELERPQGFGMEHRRPGPRGGGFFGPPTVEAASTSA
jgi:hypothetical protein